MRRFSGRVRQWGARHARSISLAALGLVLLLFAVPAVLLAQGGGPYSLAWWTIGGGGDRSSGGAFVVDGTVGQPVAGSASGGAYSVVGGFWAGALPQPAVTPGQHRIYMPLLRQGS